MGTPSAPSDRYKSVLRRFVFRRDLLRKIRYRLKVSARKLRKDPFDDLRFIFDGEEVRTIFDGGANVGQVTHFFARLFPRARIYAFEPNPAVFRILERSHADNPRVFPLQLGIGAVDGTLSFNVNANTGASSFLQASEYHAAHHAKRALPPIEVPVVTIDHFAAEHGIDHIEILKLDIEGYELQALQGAAGMLRRQAIDAIHAEVAVLRLLAGQPLFHELTAFLEGFGYHLHNLTDFVTQETPVRQAVLGNATYISERHRAFLERRYGWENCGWERRHAASGAEEALPAAR